MTDVMVETLEGLGMLPIRRFGGDSFGPRLLNFNPGAMPGRMPFINRTPAGADGPAAPPNRIAFLNRPQGATDGPVGYFPTPPTPVQRIAFVNQPGPGPQVNPGFIPASQGGSPIPMMMLPPPPASAIVTMNTSPAYGPAPVDTGVWTPPDDATLTDQWSMDAGVDTGLQDDLYASQDYQADGAGLDQTLWGLGSASDLIPYLLPEQTSPVSAPASSGGGFLSNLGTFLQNALPVAAQTYASVQATRQGNPYLGAQVGQRSQGYPVAPMGAGAYSGMAYPGASYGGGGGMGFGGPSWFSQRTILSSMSNGAVVGIAVAAGLALFMVMKKKRGA